MDALLLAVLNALWQGAALIALVSLALRTGLRRNATTACVVWSITFAVVALLPAIDFALARPAGAAAPAIEQISLRIAAPAPAPRRAPARSVVPRAETLVVRYAPAPAAPRAPFAALREAVAAQLGSAAVRLGALASTFARAWGIVVVGGWALVAGALLLRLVLAYAAVGRMKRAAAPLDQPLVIARLRAAGHRRRATVARSAQVEIPCAIGFRNPMILIPSRLVDSLDAEDLARVVLHESAHLQRYDDWVNALEQVVCALQFFQPALYVARRSIDFEREVACDDRVLEDAGEPLRYAECLARIVQRQVRGHQAAVVPGFVLRRAHVVARVRCIVDRSRDASPHLRVGAALLGAVMMAATLGIARLQVPLVAPVSAAPEIAPPAAAAPRAAAHRSATVKRAPKPALVATIPRLEPSPAASASPTAAPSPYTRPQRVRTLVLPKVRRLRVEEVHVAPRAAAEPDLLVINRVDGERLLQIVPRVRAVSAEAAVTAAATARVVTPYAVHAMVRALADAPEAPRGGAVLVRVRRSDGDILDAIDEAKYPHPSVDELIALRNQGVSADYIRRMGALGRGRPSLHDVMALAVQGVTPEYVGTLDRRLASPPTLDEVISLRVQGVSATWLDGLAAAGYPKLSANDAASLAIQGVSVAYVRGLLEAGLRNVTPAQLAALRVQGVDGSFVRRLAQHGYHNLSIDEIVRLKVSGFEP